jgi:gliding motility-associated lipoprotein GldH
MLADVVKRIWFLAIVLSFACNREDVVQSSFEEIPSQGWHADSIVSFNFDHDSGTDVYEVVMHLRHDATYPYSNLFLFRRVLLEGKEQFSDTVQVTMADVYGNWNGEGIGQLKELDLPYRKQYLRIDGEGIYTFEFQQGMRDVNLKGIRNLGLTFIRRNGSENNTDQENG